jgi:fatty acid desaturase/predicted heme/steroid binding protein
LDTPTVTMEEVARHYGRDGSYWMELRGEVYDVSEFVPRHPGGALIRLGAGRHATTLFESYHPGPALDRARRVLHRKTRRVGTLPPAEREPYGDPAFFEAVRQRVDATLRARGLGYRSGGWIVAAESLVLVLLFLGAWLWRVADGSYLAAVLGGLVMARLGFAMHSGNHAAVTRRSRTDAAVGSLMDLIGGSSLVWRVEHQFSHHGRPNVSGSDNDAEIGFPLLRFHPALPHRPWHRIQTVGLGIGMSVGLVKWVITDFVYLARGRATLAPFFVGRGAWARVIAWKVLWLALHVVIPIAVLGPLHGLLTTLVMMAVAAYYMEGIFIVNHLQRGLVPAAGAHWAVQQVQGTANWGSGSRLANWISGGLNHQIEHHLFPSMAVHLYPVISPVVRRTCEEFGLTYRDHAGFWRALAGSMGYLHALGRPAVPAAEAAVAQ